MKCLLQVVISLLILFLFAACIKNEKIVIQEKEQRQEQVAVPKEGEILEIQLSGSHDYKHEFKLSEIAEEVSYIPLETNKDCLIGNRFSFPKFTKEFIFIETGGIVFQFDKKGKFIRRINKNGQGPKECSARDFAVCEKKELIYIFDNWNLSVYIFDFSGKHIKTIKNPFKEGTEGLVLHMGCDKEGNIFYTFGNVQGNMKYKYVVVDSDGKILHKSLNHDTYNLGKRVYESTIDSYPIYETEDIYYYYCHYNDSIFKINKDYTTSVSYIIKIPNKLSLIDILRVGAGDIEYGSLSNKNRFYGTREDKQFLYIYSGTNVYSKDSKLFCSFYNKQTKQLIENINPYIKNDWDGGMKIRIFPEAQKENMFYYMVQPFKMKEMLADAINKEEAKYPDKQKAFKEMVDNMEDDDNPFIMIVKLK